VAVYVAAVILTDFNKFSKDGEEMLANIFL
jgi:hypothetical protein